MTTPNYMYLPSYVHVQTIVVVNLTLCGEQLYSIASVEIYKNRPIRL